MPQTNAEKIKILKERMKKNRSLYNKLKADHTKQKDIFVKNKQKKLYRGNRPGFLKKKSQILRLYRAMRSIDVLYTGLQAKLKALQVKK